MQTQQPSHGPNVNCLRCCSTSPDDGGSLTKRDFNLVRQHLEKLIDVAKQDDPSMFPWTVHELMVELKVERRQLQQCFLTLRNMAKVMDIGRQRENLELKKGQSVSLEEESIGANDLLVLLLSVPLVFIFCLMAVWVAPQPS